MRPFAVVGGHGDARLVKVVSLFKVTSFVGGEGEADHAFKIGLADLSKGRQRSLVVTRLKENPENQLVSGRSVCALC